MKSKGHNQGFQCIRCGKKNSKKITIEIPQEKSKNNYIFLKFLLIDILHDLYNELEKTNKTAKFDNSLNLGFVYTKTK